jgi:hypothetical protein
MCLIFVRTKHHVELNFDALEQAHTDNPDGVGILWWDNGWQQCRAVDSTYSEIEQFVRKLDRRELRWAIHFRWATAGKVNKRNCHPFPIGNGAYLMHNGVLPYTPTRKERSDTWQFAQWVKGIGVERFSQYSDLFEQATRGSRMLYALPNGALSYSGDWTHKPEGYYSNNRCFYKPITTYRPTYQSQSENEEYVMYGRKPYNRDEYDFGKQYGTSRAPAYDYRAGHRDLICTDGDSTEYEDYDTTVASELDEEILEAMADSILEKEESRQLKLELDEEV